MLNSKEKRFVTYILQEFEVFDVWILGFAERADGYQRPI